VARILIIDDEEALLRSIELTLTHVGHTCLTAETAREGLAALQQGPDLILLDLHLPDQNGLEVLKAVRAGDSDTPVVVITAFASVKGAVAAIQAGAQDYVEKPIDLEKLRLVVERCLETTRLKGRLAGYQRAQEGSARVEIVARDPAMRRALELAEQVAGPEVSSPTDLPTVLLLGETGTGKGLFAKYIHVHSPCANKPFVQINCAAVPPSLFESELFGHEKGAFTDAKTDRQGLLEAAHEGTLFLDEIGDMPVELQSKLVVALEKKQFRRVGGTRERSMDARIIAATNRDLGEAVRQGRFRQDLYYRLKVFTVELPPLRERPDELSVLADHFISRFARKYRKPPPGLSAAARESMRRYSWPGNVRELEHVLERAVLLTKAALIEPRELNVDGGEATLAGADSSAAPPRAGSDGQFDLRDPRCTLDGVEQALIEQALSMSRGNVSGAARLLGVGRGFLRRRIKRHHITIPQGLTDADDQPG